MKKISNQTSHNDQAHVIASPAEFVFELKGAAVNCPFCNESDFDKIGLKYHLENYCEEYKTLKI